eukprot:6473025-Amphidinium_carterae.1
MGPKWRCEDTGTPVSKLSIPLVCLDPLGDWVLLVVVLDDLVPMKLRVHGKALALALATGRMARRVIY